MVHNILHIIVNIDNIIINKMVKSLIFFISHLIDFAFKEKKKKKKIKKKKNIIKDF
jgi:hypothetical protein